MASVFKSAEGRRAVHDRYQALLRQWPVGNRQHRVPTRHGETFVIECGPKDAPALVLLHGTAANSASWIIDVPLWSRHFRVICIDIIGDAGFSAEVRPPYETGAHLEWLDDVMQELSLSSASLAGMSLGGWLALDYATRRPERVDKLVLISPGGVGRNRNILLWAIPLLLLGPWGRRKMLERIGGRPPALPSPSEKALLDLTTAIFTHFKPRTAKLPQVDDDSLQRLSMPVLAVLGGKDVFIDAPETKRRLEQNIADLTMRYLPEAAHFIPGQTEPVLQFLLEPAKTSRQPPAAAM